ncbi:MAG: nucleoside triphosphate pyrophosphohydrolase [Candidatus Izemoplasma sp.]|nr:nucleoside triphosphate pyrophosphohydrolase [Candidatus Izemoplasma sp.]
MKVYNKLVRDGIPDIIEKAGKNCKTKILSDSEYVHELKRKLIEESQELIEAKTQKILSRS